MIGLAATLLLALPASGPSHIEKMTRLLALEDARSAGGGELARYLKDPQAAVRRRAALAAGRIADASLVPALVELMNDGLSEVRQMAAFALGLIGEPRAVDRLSAALKDSDAVVRGRAAEALGRIGDARAARGIAELVVRALPSDAPLVAVRGDDPGSPSDPWLELRLALLALARLKDAPAAEAALLSAGRPRFDWWAAVYTAAHLQAPALRPVLLAGAASSDPRARALAARGLGALKGAESFETLARLVRDDETSVAVAAVRALGALGDARGTPLLAAGLAAAPEALLRESLLALALLPAEPGLGARLVPFVGDARPAVRAAALAALAHAAPTELLLVLSGLDPDPEWSVRAALAAALGAAGDEASLGVLFRMLEDPDPRVLPAVLEAMRRARGSDAAHTLRRHLEHPDFAVRMAAAENLAALRLPGLVAALASAYERSLDARAPGERLALVAALAAQDDPAAHETLLSAARGDPSRVVRARAAQALRGLGQPAPDPGPETALRPALDYRQAMGPYRPLPGLALFTPRALIRTARGTIEAHLNVIESPLVVESFIGLARRGFFNGLSFHHVVPGLVSQGGCPRGDGKGDPGYTLRSEIGQAPFGRGSLGLVQAGKDTGGSQFFIAHSPAPELDGDFTVFGRVVQGMDVVDQLQPGDVIERIEIWDGR